MPLRPWSGGGTKNMELYQEIIENEKGRLDLFKWKVVLVAGLGAAASGLLSSKPITPVLPLALIPLVCIYVDLLSLDLTPRICVISRYLNLAHGQQKDPSDAQYAAFVVMADQMEQAPNFLWRSAPYRKRFSTGL
jgi:hypothetical protein